ncbi:MAG TPA: cytochrome c, partial [Chryseolinea sp.]
MKIRNVIIPALSLLVIGSAHAQQNHKSYPDTARFNKLNKEELFSRGERLTLATCGSCHFGNDGLLSGKLMEDVPKVFGMVYSANITNDPAHGIGGWSNGQLAYFIRTGIKPDGKRANLAMPRFPNIADPELESIIAFLKSDSSASKASELAEPKTKIKLAGKLATKMVLDNYDYPKAPRQTTDTTFLIG